MKKYILGFIALIVFSCELAIDVDVPFKEAQLTVNSIFNPDSVWSATVSLNRHILNDTTFFQQLENAVVVIYNNETPVDTLKHTSRGRYRSITSSKPKIDVEYEVRVSAPNYQPVSGRSKIQSLVQITKAEFMVNNEGQSNQFGEINDAIRISFEDPAEVNYYQILVETKSEWYDLARNKIMIYRDQIGIKGNDPEMISEYLPFGDTYNSPMDGILLKDILFNGKKVVTSINLDHYYKNADITIFLRALNEDYYKYKATAKLQINVNENPFAQPVEVYQNINNGFGIFAGYAQSTYTIGYPRPMITEINPSKGRPRDKINIYGKNLLNSYVSFKGITSNGHELMTYSSVVQSNENMLEVIIPDNAVTGKIVVGNHGKIAVSDVDFEVIK